MSPAFPSAAWTSARSGQDFCSGLEQSIFVLQQELSTVIRRAKKKGCQLIRTFPLGAQESFYLRNQQQVVAENPPAAAVAAQKGEVFDDFEVGNFLSQIRLAA